jgi:hypothetical protein
MKADTHEVADGPELASCAAAKDILASKQDVVRL